MIIKELNIESFAGLKNKKIILEKGCNLVYGENEVGKSSIQSFIKIMLYGMNASRSKDIKQNERIKYKPFTGELIKGEMVIVHENTEIIIKRIFGATKKDDSCKIYDKSSGVEIENIDKEEPGKTLLGISKNTFLKTLFISQLGVSVQRDKEEELLEKTANLICSGDENISVNKALEKLIAIRKKLTTQRKTGEVDNLKNTLLCLNEERYQGYRLSEENIDNESSLIQLKEENILIREEIGNLEIYKKYLKKVKLQKEYEDITSYLKKSQELKEKEKFIESELTTESGVINEDILNDIKEENALYLRLRDLLEEERNKYNLTFNELESKKSINRSFIELEQKYKDYKNSLRFALDRLKSVKKSINYILSIQYKLNEIDKKKDERKTNIGDVYKLKENHQEIRSLLSTYEYKLKELQHNAKKISLGERNSRALNKLKKQKSTHQLLLIILIVVTMVVGIISKGNILLTGVALAAVAFIGYLFMKDTMEIKSRESNSGGQIYLEELQDEINEIEKELVKYKEKLKASSYEEFIQKLKMFDDYVTFEEKANEQIEEFKSIYNASELNSLKDEESKINTFVKDGFRLLSVSTVQDLISALDKYDEVKEDLLRLEIQLKKDEESLVRIEGELSIREERIREKLSLIGLRDIDLIDLEDSLLKLRDKLIKRRDIKKTLDSIEETYKVLSKDKDIEFIKEDLKEFISKDLDYSYKTEEEIDEQTKLHSNKLIEIEKGIKDLENEIKNRFIGKREIHEIEEDIQEIKEKITSKEVTLKAIEIAEKAIEKANKEIRGSFGNELNKEIIKKFALFTNDKYKETYLSDNYELMVRDEKELFKAELLSNGANDQLYLALRLAFIDILFDKKSSTIILDDAFVQYDDSRLRNVLIELINFDYDQIIIFTCQKREESILIQWNKNFNYISLKK